MSNRDVAVAIIKAEHRALGAVLHTLQELLGKVEAGHVAPEFGLLSTVLYYIDDFQQRCHHPKEDEYIFKSLSTATSEFDDVINGLQAEHVSGAHAVAQLHRCLVHFQGGASDGLEMLKSAVKTYAARMDEHMRCEEDLIERSRDIISEQEWVRIAAAFDENNDPLFGNNRRAEFGQLYRRIAVLAPRKLKEGLYPGSHSIPNQS